MAAVMQIPLRWRHRRGAAARGQQAPAGCSLLWCEMRSTGVGMTGAVAGAAAARHAATPHPRPAADAATRRMVGPGGSRRRLPAVGIISGRVALSTGTWRMTPTPSGLAV